MAIFPFKYFSFSTQYPETGTRIQLGQSYQFDTPPTAPDQRLFTLTLGGMAYFVDAGGQLDLTQAPERNLGALEAFYNTHKRAISFTLPHPVYGDVSVKFNRPLSIPAGLPGGGGAVPDFDIELIEQP